MKKNKSQRSQAKPLAPQQQPEQQPLADQRPWLSWDEYIALSAKRGSEPYWMQDIRLALRHLEQKRLRRAVQSSGLS